MDLSERKTKAINGVKELFPDVGEKVIEQLAELFPTYSSDIICDVVSNLYWSIVYNDELDRNVD